jgi:hypothetical protein
MTKLRMKWIGHVACLGETKIANTILVRKSEGLRPLEKSRQPFNRIK